MDDKALRRQINGSGFPLQIRVEEEVTTTSATHKWYITAHEHRWISSHTGAEGFIDLILQKDSWRMVIECKRTGGGAWVFLHPNNDVQKGDARLMVAHRTHNDPLLAYWADFGCNPPSWVSAFCIVPGQGSKDTPMLERVCDLLLDSLESLAEEELSIGPQPSSDEGGVSCTYIPVVVTNTELMLCQFEPGEVDLAKGELPADSGTFQAVPMIRFQKELTTKFATRDVPMNLREASRENQRTVFVVHAPALPDFLQHWDV